MNKTYYVRECWRSEWDERPIEAEDARAAVLQYAAWRIPVVDPDNGRYESYYVCEERFSSERLVRADEINVRFSCRLSVEIAV